MYDTDYMKLWNSVEKTDPAHTKKVKFGRGFTAIDPHSQVMNATKAFGPAGEGWGWNVMRVEYTVTNDVAILVGLWVKDELLDELPISMLALPQWNSSYTPGIQQWGQASLYIDAAESKKDTDAFKKAMTDGLTKCLSYLGFNADVFLGKFDDNKYVQQRQEEVVKDAAAERKNSPEYEGAVSKADAIIKNIEACETREEVSVLREKVKKTFNEVKSVDRAEAQRMSTAVQKKLSEFPEANV